MDNENNNYAFYLYRSHTYKYISVSKVLKAFLRLQSNFHDINATNNNINKQIYIQLDSQTYK